jgi:TolB-like protein/DNA-binding winged helix-turn-helix (wHTH) protein/tetratricopeptide (TPR) repeat protein
MADEQPRMYCFQGFALDPRARLLRGPGGEDVALTPKAFDTLLYLIEQRDRVVGKDELLSIVWRGRVVEENNLTQAVSAIRRTLGASAGDHRFLVTVPGHGYRFVATMDDSDALASEASVAAVPIRRATDAQAVVAQEWAWQWPMLALLLAVLALLVALAWTRPAQTPVAPLGMPADASLAVLPFHSLSGGTRDDLLALGLADTLITRIGSSTKLQVRSLASSQRFLNSGGSPLVAAKELGAKYVLEGTTQRSGEQVRVDARLLDAADGRMLWSGSYDEPIARVFALQDRVANDLTRILSIKFAALRGASPCDGANAEAYRAYLSGQYQMNRPSADRLREALQDFHRAIELDPSCARAYAGMAFAHRALVMTADHVPREEFPLVKAAVAKALAINPELAEAYASQGFTQFWYDWDWEASEASFKRAIALNPSLAEAHFGYAHLLANTGRMQQSAQQARLAIEADPLSPVISTVGSFFIGQAGAREEAKRIQDGVAERDPDYWTIWMVRGRRLAAQGDGAGATADLNRAVAGCGGCAQAQMVLGAHHALSGDRAAAEAVLSVLAARRRASYAPLSASAAIHAALGEKEKALDLLERGYAERDIRMSFLGLDSYWSSLRAEPRFRVLMQKLRLREPPPQKLKSTLNDQDRGGP